jgi:hypothetical protein
VCYDYKSHWCGFPHMQVQNLKNLKFAAPIEYLVVKKIGAA